MYNNKKVINASPTEYNGIKFKSRLEVSCYKLLTEAGLNFTYESEKIVIWEGTRLKKTRYFRPSSKRNMTGLKEYNKVLMNVTYTPDFVVTFGEYPNGYKFYIDVKGKENDVYPIKKKMFLKSIDTRNDSMNYMFFEPHNVNDIRQTISIIKECIKNDNT